MENWLLYDHHLQLCLLHNVVIDTVSDKQVNKHNVGGVDEGNVLKVKVRVERLKTNVLQVKVKVKCLKNQEEKWKGKNTSLWGFRKSLFY